MKQKANGLLRMQMSQPGFRLQLDPKQAQPCRPGSESERGCVCVWGEAGNHHLQGEGILCMIGDRVPPLGLEILPMKSLGTRHLRVDSNGVGGGMYVV